MNGIEKALLSINVRSEFSFSSKNDSTNSILLFLILKLGLISILSTRIVRYIFNQNYSFSVQSTTR